MKILPAIDIQNGRCVRLLKGDFKEVTEYSRDPLAQAKIFKSNHLNYLHIVDLNGAESGNQMNKDVITKILEISDISCLLYTSPSPRDATLSRMPSSA